MSHSLPSSRASNTCALILIVLFGTSRAAAQSPAARQSDPGMDRSAVTAAYWGKDIEGWRGADEVKDSTSAACFTGKDIEGWHGADEVKDSTAAASTLISTVGGDIHTALRHGWGLATLSAWPDDTEWWYVGASAAGTVAAFAADHEVRRIALRSQAPATRELLSPGDILGSWGGPALGGGLYVAGLVLDDEWTRTTGRLTLEALAYAGAATTVLKTLLGRSRPYVGDGAFAYRPIQFNTDRTSLPSGHATMAWAMAGVLDARIDHPIASVLVYGAALITSAHRVYHDRHWFSDTILGAAVGWGVARAVVAMEDHESTERAARAQHLGARTTESPVPRLAIVPVLEPSGAGLLINIRF